MTKGLTIRKQQLLILAEAAAFFVLYLCFCFSDNVWTDEAFTIELLKNDFAGIIHGTAMDVHPPLYYLLVKCITLLFGSSLLVLKLSSVLPVILCLTVGSFTVRRLFGFRQAVCFGLFLGAIPCVTEYVTQVRMYSLAIFFILMMSLWAYEACTRRLLRFFAGVSIMAAAAAYTHYFAFVSAVWIYGILFLVLLFTSPKDSLKCLLAAACSFVVYLPWLTCMILQVQGVSNNYWIEKITGETMMGFLPFIFDMKIPYSTTLWMILVVLSLVSAVVSLVRICSGRRCADSGCGLAAAAVKDSAPAPASASERFDFMTVSTAKQVESDAKVCRAACAEDIFCILILLVPVLTAITGVIISNVMRPIFIIRYVVPCMGLLALFLSLGLTKLFEGRYGIFLMLFPVAAVGVNAKNAIYLEYQWTHTEETKAFLAEHVGEEDIIAYNYEAYDFIYDYYWDDSEKCLWQDIDLEKTPYKNIWLLDTIYFPYPTEEYLNSLGWTKEYMGNFGIEHNNFKIYRIHRLEE